MSTVSMTGLEWNRFYSDKAYWPESAYHDDTVVRVNGVEHEDLDKIPNGAKVIVECGYVMFDNGTSMDLGDYAKKWQQEQSTVTGCFECAKDQLESVKAAILAAGGTLVA